MTTHKIANGEVVYNDGSFAEVETSGVEGIEEGLLLATLQLHVEDTQDNSREFRMRFPVGTRLRIRTTTEITVAERSVE